MGRMPRLNFINSYSNSPPENNSSEPESNEKASLSNTREIANNTPNGYMVLYMKHDEVEKICVFNLPGMNTTSSSPSRASPENNSLLTVHDRSSRNNQTVSEECKICMDAVANVVLIPCGHMGFCYNCSAKVAVRTTTCPICRIDIESWQTIHHQSSFCKVCETSPANIVLRPCGDMCLCHSCSDGIKQCPICRMPTATMQKIFQN